MTATQSISHPRCRTRYFGVLEYAQDGVLEFPEGIPGFEQEKHFLVIRQPMNDPLVFLQSLQNPDLCFVTLPAASACPGFRLSISPEDLEVLGLDPRRQPEMGREILCLVIVSLYENAPPTGNLLAPVVVNLRTRQSRQVIQTESTYSPREALPLREAACS